MPSTIAPFLDLAASIDRRLLRNIQVPVKIVGGPGSFTISALDRVILANASSGAVTLNLPSAIGIPGMIFEVKKTDTTSNAVVISAQPGQTIDGASSISMQDPRESRIIVSDGGSWHILSDFDVAGGGGGGVGFILGQATQPLDQGDTSGSIIDVPGATVSFSLAQTTDVLIIGSCAGIRAQDNPGWITELYIKVDAGPDERMVFQSLGVADADVNCNGPGSFAIVKTLSSGAHTVKLRYKAVGANAVLHGPTRLIVIGAMSPPPSTGDIYAATRVVSPIVGEGTDTSIQSAINNLPAEGGTVFVKQGTYIISSPITFPGGDVPVVLRGAGIGATKIVQSSPGQPIFSIPVSGTNPKFATVEHLSLENPSGNIFFSNRSNLRISLRSIDIVSGKRLFDSSTGSDGRFEMDFCFAALEAFDPSSGIVSIDWTIDRCVFIFSPTVAKILAGGGYFIAENSSFSILSYAEMDILTNPAFISTSYIDIVGGGKINLGNNSVVQSCYIAGASLFLVGNRNRISNCLLIEGSSTNARISVSGNENIVSGNRFDVSLQNSVTEGVSAKRNVYTGNSGYGIVSLQSGGESIFEGSRRHSKADTSQDAFVTIFDLRNPNGIHTSATVKNTGGVNSIVVRESVVDLFGTVGTQNTTVLPGSNLLLSSLNNVGIARPPYSAYKVDVKSDVAGFSSTYEVQAMIRTPSI